MPPSTSHSPAARPAPARAAPRRRAAARASALARERDVLRALLHSVGEEADLGPLLTRVLAEACAALAADRGAVGLFLPWAGVLRHLAVHRLPDELLGRDLPAGVGLGGEVARTRAPVRVRHYRDLPSPAVPLLARLPDLGEDAVLGVPLWWDGELLGAVTLARAPHPVSGRPRVFRARDVVALEAFARDAAAGVAAARRHAAERRRAERLALIAHVARLVTGDLHLDDVLQRAADATHELLGYDNVAIATLDHAAPDVLDLRHFGGAYKREIGGAHRIPVTRGLMGAAARTREVVLVNDTAADPRYLPTPGTVGSHAELAVPLLVAGELLGVLNVERRAPFDDDDVAHLRIVADQLAVAVENARLHEAAWQAAVLEERQRLARELHDSVTQQLFTATMVAQSVGGAYARDAAEGARRADMLVDLTRGALGEMRALLAELRPAAPGASAEPPPPDAGRERLRREGLVAALTTFAASHVAPHLAPSDDATGMAPADSAPPPGAVWAGAVTLDASGYRPQAQAWEEALYRIAREALHNVVKHARASRVAVRLAVEGGPPAVVRLTVRDDGVGVAAGAAPRGDRRRAGGGLGLVSMRERAAALGGTLALEGGPGLGTTLTITIPCPGRDPGEETL
jgi:signal transduction histidine kinase